MTYKGVIQQLRGQNFAIFLPLPLLRGQFLYPDVDKNSFWLPSPLILYT